MKKKTIQELTGVAEEQAPHHGGPHREQVVARCCVSHGVRLGVGGAGRCPEIGGVTVNTLSWRERET